MANTPDPRNAFFQAAHSACIDVLTELFPKPKLELGMPRKETSWNPPQDFLAHAQSFELPPQQNPIAGTLILGATDTTIFKKITPARFNALIELATQNFAHPLPLSRPYELSKKSPIQKNWIWVPFSVGAVAGRGNPPTKCQVYLAVGF